MNTTHILPMEKNYMLEIMQIIVWAKRSQFDKSGEKVALVTVKIVKEVFAWVNYAYLFIKVRMNHLACGIGWTEMVVDSTLSYKQMSLVIGVTCFFEYENIIVRDEEINELVMLTPTSWALESKIGSSNKYEKNPFWFSYTYFKVLWIPFLWYLILPILV